MSSSAFSELQVLKAEERTLTSILSKVQDQLNRLKVEEMALMSQIRDADENMEEEISEQDSEPEGDDVALEDMPALDLQLKWPAGKNSEDMEEEEEEEEDEDGEDEGDHNQLTAFLNQLKKAKHGP